MRENLVWTLNGDFTVITKRETISEHTIIAWNTLNLHTVSATRSLNIFKWMVVIILTGFVMFFCTVHCNTECPTRYRTPLAGWPLLRVATIRRTTDTFLFISYTTNTPLFKFRCNIFIGVRIIKEMPGSVASGTHCIIVQYKPIKCTFVKPIF
jgi:hypothetical protein